MGVKSKASNNIINVFIMLLLVCFCLSAIGCRQDAHSLTKKLGHKESGVREDPAFRLGEKGDVRVVEPLIATLKNDKDGGVRRKPAFALSETKDSYVAEAFVAVLKDENSDVRRGATRALGMTKDPHAVEPLIVVLKDESRIVRSESCNGNKDVPAEFSFNLHPNQPKASGRGAVSVADMNGDGLMDYVVMTKTGDYGSGTAGMGVYKHDGTVLWYNHNIDIYNIGNADALPGWSAPGYSKGDVDGDGQIELVYIKEDLKTLVVLNGKTGGQEKTINLDPDGNEPGFGLCQIVNLRSQGDKDVICQGWDIDHFNIVAAFRLDNGQRLWRRTDYFGVKHGGFRAVDIDNDGKDEVAGAVIIDNDGTRMNSWDYPVTINTHSAPHFDSIFIYDVRPDIPGLEIILLEEWRDSQENHTSVVKPDRVLWRKHYNKWEPQNAAVGNFDSSKPGLEIWCRSRFDTDQKPWVYDAYGNVIADWVMNEKKPSGWSTKGIEAIYVIDWDGGDKQYIAAKERHTEGDVAVINPMTGDFIKTWDNKASRIYVADVFGDYREEIIVLNGEENKIYVYSNDAVNTNTKPSYWRKNYYVRQKDNFNYYSP